MTTRYRAGPIAGSRPAGRTNPILALAVATLALTACRGADGPPEQVVVPKTAAMPQVVDSLVARGIVEWPVLFGLYVRIRGADTEIRPGVYEFRRRASWSEVVDVLVGSGAPSLTAVVPEGWTLRQIADRLAPVTGIPADSIARRLHDPALARDLGAPGPTLEGYLFPATYWFRRGRSLESLARRMLRRYRRVWTAERRARLDSLGMTENEIVTLASIVQAETRHADEMPVIAAVFHNRLRADMRLQADPTVRYALDPGTPFHYTHIDSLAGHPYNTYERPGLPPGPIGAPGEAAIDAALHPAEVPYLFFFARPDGRHQFSRTFEEHRAAIERFRRDPPRPDP